MTGLENEIAAAGRAQGFILVGFAALRELPRREFYSRWLADERHGEMAYLAREPERRFDPRRLDSRLRSVISLGFPYQAPAPVKLDWRRELRGAIASYAMGEDYHDRVMARARLSSRICSRRFCVMIPAQAAFDGRSSILIKARPLLAGEV